MAAVRSGRKRRHQYLQRFESRVPHRLGDGPLFAGEFRQQRGSAVLSWPFTEHAFLFEGRVEITDLATGEKAVYGPGDGWIVKQGSRTLWNVLEPIRKSFFQYTE